MLFGLVLFFSRSPDVLYSQSGLRGSPFLYRPKLSSTIVNSAELYGFAALSL
jgi:hypothetical protein